MAQVIEIHNPIEPFRDTCVHVVDERITIRDWLQKTYPGFVEFERPTVCIYNGKPLLREQWAYTVLGERDVVNFVAMPGTPIQALYVLYAILVVATVVMAISMRQNMPTPGDTPEADPVYTLKGQRNQIRLGEPIEVPYGRVRMWPSYAAQPYNKYANNQQWLYQLFCLGQGEYVVDSVNIEDTPIGNFQDVEFEICPPGVPVTLFPDNVITSVEVANIELFGPNEPEANAVWIVDSEGDPELGYGATGHYAYTNAGPFVANPTQTQTDLIELDVTLPRGLYVSQDNGNLGNETVTALFEARLIDDAGAPLGAWFTLATFTKTLSTVTPQRFTIECEVVLGRYEVRAARTNNKNTSARAGNTLQWEGMRAFLPNTRNYGDVTMLAVKARASNNLNDNAAQRVNVVAVRKLPTWNVGTQSWNAPTPTRSIVWAFCDIFRSEYGAQLTDQFLDLDGLAALDAVFTTREEFCDWIFEQRLTAWEAARLVAGLGRAVPMLNGSRVTMVRDEPKTLPTAVFNQENIVASSLRWEMKLHGLDANDGLEVEYTDPDTWKAETVPCLLPGEAGDNMEKVKLNGCTSRTHAYRWGMWRRASTRYLRENIVFQTGLEGHIPSYGDLISIVHDVPRWGKGGFVVGLDVAKTILTLSEPVSFDPPGSYRMLLRRKNGEASSLLTVTAGADPFHVVLSTPLDDTLFGFDPQGEPPLFLFGLSNAVGRYAKVVNLTPSDDSTVEVTAVPYREEVYSFDTYLPPILGDTNGGPPKAPALPSVAGLIVTKSANLLNEVIATWNASRGASYYVAQMSYDGTSWETLSDYIEGTTWRFTVLPRYLYVRVAAVTTGMGEWAYWTGEAPVEKTNVEIDNDATPNPVTGVTVTQGFGMLWLDWVNPTNAKIKNVHVYAATTNVQPALPKFTLAGWQNSLAHNGLPDDQQWYYWFVVESIAGKLSTVAGPFNGTTVNGVTLDHLVPGGVHPVELVSVMPSTGNYKGRLVYLTANDSIGGTFLADKLYRWVGAGTYASPVTGKASWSTQVLAEDVSGQIQTTQIADNAISTPKLAANAVTADQLAANSVVAGKIAAAAVTASAVGANEVIAQTANIKDGIIATAKIADLAVSTLKIAGNAVTVPTSAFSSGVVAITNDSSGTTETQLQSATHTATGAPIHVLVSFLAMSTDFAVTGTYFFRIKRGSTVLFESGYCWFPYGTNSPVSFAIVDQPGAGTYTYSVQVVLNPYGPSTCEFSQRSILLLETKK